LAAIIGPNRIKKTHKAKTDKTEKAKKVKIVHLRDKDFKEKSKGHAFFNSNSFQENHQSSNLWNYDSLFSSFSTSANSSVSKRFVEDLLTTDKKERQ
jgi:hypothetical protein